MAIVCRPLHIIHVTSPTFSPNPSLWPLVNPPPQPGLVAANLAAAGALPYYMRNCVPTSTAVGAAPPSEPQVPASTAAAAVAGEAGSGLNYGSSGKDSVAKVTTTAVRRFTCGLLVVSSSMY